MMVEADHRESIRRATKSGLLGLVAMVATYLTWAAVVNVDGAVIAPGIIVVESNIKKVQHPTGGIVSEIFVKDGDVVVEGQILLSLDATSSKASLGIVESQLDELEARAARLRAERDDRPMEWVPLITSTAYDKAFAGEKTFFTSRLQSFESQKSQLNQKRIQTEEEVNSLSAQLRAKGTEAALVAQELKGVEDLYKQNLMPIFRVNQLRRDFTRLTGESEQLKAEIARAEGRGRETSFQYQQLIDSYQSDVIKELREVEAKIAEATERRIAAQDQFRRIDIRSPQSGRVHQSVAHTVGGVIGPGEQIMQIVPQDDVLVIEARVAPQDIDQIKVGSECMIRVNTGAQRNIPDVKGVVRRIAADLSRDAQSNALFFTVRAEFTAPAVNMPFPTRPGMLAEVFIRTAERTPMQYLLGPLTDQISRAFRER